MTAPEAAIAPAPSTAPATHLVEVEFKGNRRVFYQWTGEAAPPRRAAVIVKVERGEDLGRVHSTGELAERRKAGTTHGKASPEELPMIVRLATPREVDTAVRLRADEHAVRRAAVELVRELTLEMKISDTEWQWDRRRLTCYFTAETRVDFRELVRRLERRFSTRVHMWHIGVRDEAKRLDGIGRCGRQFCSASWLPELLPVKSSSAKDQRLSTLNPAQISGTCGRLMCCLRYEHEFYVQSRKRFPKEGKILQTAAGEEKVVANDIFRDRVTLRLASGESRIIPLAQLRYELGEAPMPVEEEVSTDSEADTEDGEERRRAPLVPLARAERPDPRPESRAEPRADPRPSRPRDARTDDRAAADRGPRRDERSGSRRPERRPSTPAAPSDPAANTDATGPTDDATRKRRRRGRRGGRRGRGDGTGPASPADQTD
ncbi:MAG: regulatory iron-sulfur-containing complex subunit RicT [Gemmatimonadota bacterium]|nr:regulatory iron-sulfur-containing complex subunit RicT [Gemmatimonadota bacterium]